MSPAALPSPTVGVLELGPLTIHAYALCILAGIAAAIWIGDMPSTELLEAMGAYNEQLVKAGVRGGVAGNIMGGRHRRNSAAGGRPGLVPGLPPLSRSCHSATKPPATSAATTSSATANSTCRRSCFTALLLPESDGCGHAAGSARCGARSPPS